MSENSIEKMKELIRAVATNCENDEDPFCSWCPLLVENKCILLKHFEVEK